MNLIGFISALYNDWIAIMSGMGSILFTALGFIKHKKFDFFKTPGTQRKIFWTLALLCFFFASVSVWTNEHNKRIGLEAQLKKNEPNLNCQVLLMQIHPVGNKDESSIILLGAIITNIGAPSIAIDFQLKVRMGNRFIPGEPTLQPIKQYIFKGYQGKPDIRWSADDYLPRKCLSPITTGGGTSGYFIVFLRNIPPTQISYNNNCSVIFSFRDVFGKSYSYNFPVPEKEYNAIDLSKMRK